MLIYIKGTDNFLAKKAIDQLKAKYLEKNPDGSELIEIEGAGQLPNWADLQAVPLFATSRLVIIRQAGLLPTEAQQTLASFSSQLPTTTVAVIWDAKVPHADLLSSLSKAIKTISADPLSETQTRKFIQTQAKELGVELNPQQISDLLESAGNDLWFIQNELRYLATAGKSEETGKKKVIDEPFVYFQLIRQKAWSKIAQQLTQDFAQGKPFELLIGSLAAALRKEPRSKEKLVLTDLLADIDLGTKTGLLDPVEAITLLAFHLSKPDQDRVQWKELYYETVA